MKKYILASLALTLSASAFAQTEVLKITLNDETETTVPVSSIKELTFGEAAAPTAASVAGEYTGIQKATITMGPNAMNYFTSAAVIYTLTSADDGTLTVSYPGYTLTGTMMGDLELGAIEIKGLVYDAEKGGFYKDYSNDGLKQHFKNSSMDQDFPLGSVSTILVKITADGIEVSNPFQLGNMPFPLAGTYLGMKK